MGFIIINAIVKNLSKTGDYYKDSFLVDTGSLDRTREIVKELGGKVIETKWEDDFSKAKNLVN